MICTIRDIIIWTLNAAKSTFIIWTTDIYGPHHFVFQNFGNTLYEHSLFFARPLIYKICVSVLSFLFYEGRFLYLNVLVPDFCSINGFCWHMVLNCSPVNLLLVHLILKIFEDSLLNCGDR